MAVWSTSASDCSVALLLTLLVGAVLAVPVQPEEEPWWFNPCHSKMPKIRHSRSTNDPVKMQFGMFSNHLNNAIKEINQLYGITVTSKPSYKIGKLKWLKLAKMQKKLNTKNKKTYLKELNKQLQYFAGTLDVLRKAKVITTISSFKHHRRESIYHKITLQLKLYMCEVQEGLAGTPPAHITLDQMKIPQNLLRELDNTKAHIIDVTFFTKMQKYFKCVRMLNDPKRKNGRKQKGKMCGVMRSNRRT